MRLVAGMISLLALWPLLDGRAAVAEPSLCKCRAPTGLFSLGEQTCLQTPDGPRQATCVMVLNNTSWRIDGGSCHLSRRGMPLDYAVF
jgi:hypothetical protein